MEQRLLFCFFLFSTCCLCSVLNVFFFPNNMLLMVLMDVLSVVPSVSLCLKFRVIASLTGFYLGRPGDRSPSALPRAATKSLKKQSKRTKTAPDQQHQEHADSQTTPRFTTTRKRITRPRRRSTTTNLGLLPRKKSSQKIAPT